MRVKQKLIIVITLIYLSFNNLYGQKVTIPSYEQTFYMFNQETMVYDSVSTKKGKAMIILDLNTSKPTITVDHGNQPYTANIFFVSLPGKIGTNAYAITIKYIDSDKTENQAVYKYVDDNPFSALEFAYMSIKTVYKIYDPNKQVHKEIKARLIKVRESL